MKHCIVHIGMQKSGSASIQRSLDGFASDRVLYARLGSPNHGPAMYNLFAPDELLRRPPRVGRPIPSDPEAYAAWLRNALNESIAAAEGRTLLISGESLSVMPADGVARMRDYLVRRFDTVTIAGYVRPPAALMSSRFQQRVVSGALKRFDIKRQYHNYRRIFGSFDGIFGRENVRFWKFDPSTFPGGCVVRDFCSRLGIELPAEKIVRRNESLTRHAVALLYIYRGMSARCGFAELSPAEARQIGSKLAALGGEKFRFSPDVIGPILAQQRVDIEWMEKRIGESLQEELGEHQPGDVRSEADLLMLDPGLVDMLTALVDPAASTGIREVSHEEVAALVQALRIPRKMRTKQSELA